jgi:acyl-coenzyme A thioesterase PaaI-like protein
MEIGTHQKISESLCGKIEFLEKGHSRVSLTATDIMAVDDSGLVHGGFVFGLADYAAMIAVNHPNVVLGGADVTFIKPVRVGESLIAEARIQEEKGKKKDVLVEVSRGDQKVFEGRFSCFVLEKHVLSKD